MIKVLFVCWGTLYTLGRSRDAGRCDVSECGRGYSTIHTVRGVVRPAFQMAVDDDILVKNPFGFQLAGGVVNDSVIRETKVPVRRF